MAMGASMVLKRGLGANPQLQLARHTALAQRAGVLNAGLGRRRFATEPADAGATLSSPFSHRAGMAARPACPLRVPPCRVLGGAMVWHGVGRGA
jgi:hypothetical protein